MQQSTGNRQVAAGDSIHVPRDRKDQRDGSRTSDLSPRGGGGRVSLHGFATPQNPTLRKVIVNEKLNMTVSPHVPARMIARQTTSSKFNDKKFRKLSNDAQLRSISVLPASGQVKATVHRQSPGQSKDCGKQRPPKPTSSKEIVQKRKSDAINNLKVLSARKSFLNDFVRPNLPIQTFHDKKRKQPDYKPAQIDWSTAKWDGHWDVPELT